MTSTIPNLVNVMKTVFALLYINFLFFFTKKKSISLAIALIICSLNVRLFAQTQTPGNITISSCNYTFTDNGGVANNYSNNFTGATTFFPATAGCDKIAISFSAFNTEWGTDLMRIYDGNSILAPLIGTYSGTTAPPPTISTATDGSLTIEFISNAAITSTGWEAIISCYTSPGLPSVVVTDVACGGQSTGAVNVTPLGGAATNYTYLWSSGETTKDIFSKPAGVYSVTLTDALSCASVKNMTIAEPPVLSSFIANSSNVFCNGGSTGAATAAATGGLGFYFYQWNDPSSQLTASAIGLTAGTFICTVSDDNGCTSFSTVNIAEPTVLTQNIVVVNESCAGNCDASLTTTATGGTSNYTYQWSGTASTSSFITGLCAGTYICTVVDANSCKNVQTAIVNPNTITANINAPASQCFLGNSVFFDASASTSSVGNTLSYSWNFGDGGVSTLATPTYSYTAIGSYLVQLTVSDGFCADTASVPFTLYDNPTITLSTSVPPSCTGASNGSVGVSATGATLPYTFFWDNNQTTQTITGLVAGIYNITVSSANGCNSLNGYSLQDPLAMTVFPTTTSNYNGAQISCNGAFDGAATVSATGGAFPYSFLWSNGSVSVNTSGLGAGFYSVTATDANNCKQTAGISLTEPTILSINQLCTNTSGIGTSDGTSSVTVTGGTTPYSFAWSNGDLTQNITLEIAGVYTVTVTDFNGCIDTSTCTISSPVCNVTASVVANNVSCFGGTDGSAIASLLGGTSPYFYQWSDGQTSANATGLSTGTYDVVITDFTGCIDSIAVIIIQPAAIVLTQTCNSPISAATSGSSSVSATGGNGSYAFTWSNGQTGTIVTGLNAGIITVTAIDGSGCIATASCNIVAFIPTGCNITLTSNVINPDTCGIGVGKVTVTATGPGAPYSYLWENGKTTSLSTGLFGGVNYITVTGVNGCSESLSITISGAGIDSVQVNATPTACGTSNGSVLATVYGGSPPYTYVWFDSNFDTLGLGFSMSNLPALAYIIVVFDANGCEDFGGNFVQNIGGPTLMGISSTDVPCGNSSDGTVDVVVAGSTPPYSYSWQELETGSQYTGQTVSGLPLGLYFVTITDSQIPLCATHSAVYIFGPDPLVDFYDGFPETCVGSSDGSVIPDIYGGVSPYSYQWSNGTTGNSLNNIPAGAYSVTITDVMGCQISASGSISVTSNLSVLNNVIQPNCGNNNGSISLTPQGGVGGYSFSWNGGLGIGPFHSGLAPGTFNVTVTDGLGCSDVTTFTLFGSEPITFVTSSMKDTCSSGVGVINIDTVTGGLGSYIYSLDNVNYQLSTNFTDLVTNTFSVYVSDSSNCMATTQVFVGDTLIDIRANIVISSDTICAGNEVTITVNGGNQYNWTTINSTSSTILTVLDSSTYFPVEITKGTCVFIDSAYVFVENSIKCLDLTIEIPNAFSPDGDGKNDTWVIQGIEFTNNRVSIFNRWGDFITEFNNYDNAETVWKGTTKDGQPLPTGTYFYVVEIEGKIIDKNWIQIVR